ncbi:hypothetical protein H7K33_03330 [Mycobacterium paraense]|uniref:hypothetical protein n=1 Tax=Mycobacterium paraense TaxID=767916 RepID=UPI0011537717|nr:hypothetical protein [Mycobacterium paraense]MCV7441249.1 hypothetical protein [Mycobacterium paraense]
MELWRSGREGIGSLAYRTGEMPPGVVQSSPSARDIETLGSKIEARWPAAVGDMADALLDERRELMRNWRGDQTKIQRL